MALIIVCIWLACLLAYLASAKQQLIATCLPNVIGWGGFVLFNAVALYALTRLFIPSAAMLIALSLIMAMWLALTLLAAHLKRQFLLTNGIGVGLFLAIWLNTGAHVA